MAIKFPSALEVPKKLADAENIGSDAAQIMSSELSEKTKLHKKQADTTLDEIVANTAELFRATHKYLASQ